MFEKDFQISIKLAAQSSANRFVAGLAAERRARSLRLRAAHFFYFFNLKLALRRRSRPPSPSNERSSFRKLLRTFATAPYGTQSMKWHLFPGRIPAGGGGGGVVAGING